MSWIGYRWFLFRHWKAGLPNRIAFWLAWKLPRRVALWVFIRVYTATITELSWDTGDIYRQCYDGWEKGNGR